MELPSLSKCNTCGAEIYWVKTKSGKSMPVDAVPVPDGNIILGGQLAIVLKKGEAVSEGVKRYVSHFATCAQAAQHRRK